MSHCVGLQPARFNEQWKVECHLKTSFQRRREADRAPLWDGSEELSVMLNEKNV